MSEGIWMKKSLVAAVAAGTLVLAACNDESGDATTTTTSTETVTTNYQTINNPTGSITGVVKDTNGNPIEGATVYLGNQTAVTNVGGQYYFAEVAVTQTVKNDGDSYAQALALTIIPPTGYLGATVTVTPQAQYFDGSQTSASDSNEVTNPASTFIDGFQASAGTAVLPATTATVTGVLRNEETGEVLSGVLLALDMLSTSTGVNQEDTQDGVTTSYSTQGYTATTSSSGAFTFTNVPSDAILKLSASNYTVNQNADTSSENTTVALGDVDATPISSADSVAPWVKSVSQVVDQSAARGMLNDDATTVITVVFSEVMSSIDANSIRVRDVDGGQYLGFTSTLSGNTLTLTLTNALTEGHEIDVLLLRDDFVDTATPANALGLVDNNGANSNIGFDDTLTTSVGSTYVRLKLKSFEEANMDAEQVTLDETSQQRQDVRGGALDLEQLQTSNDAFLDVDNWTAGIHQLNTADDDDSSTTADAQERMQALATALAGTIGSLESTDVFANTAGIQFAATNASYYEVDVLDSDGTSKFNGLARIELDGGTFDPAPNANRFVSDVAENENLYLVLQGVEPGDQVQITPFDEFGYSGTMASVELVDNVSPTTILQNAYGVAADNNNGSVVSLQYGDGGEQSSTPDADIGTPYLNITPRMLSIVDGTADGTDEEGLEGLYTLKQLFDLNTVNAIPGDANEGELFIDVMNFLDGNIAGSTPGVYDANAYTAWNVGSRTIGVAFSEDIVLNDAALITETNIDDAVLSNYVANIDVLRQDDNGSTFADLVQFDIDNVIAFANGDHNGVIDFQAAISDVEGNSGATNAKVVVGDAMPPLVVSAQYKGSSLTINFNEDVVVDTSTTITLGSVPITLDQDTVDAFNASADHSVLNVLSSTWGDDLDRTAEFTLGQYDEADNADGSFPSDLHRHARLDFSDIEDTRGNNWDDYSTGATATSEEFFFFQPDFAAVDTTGLFSVTGSDLGTVLGSAEISVRFTGTHPIDISGWDANNDGTISQNEFENKFTFTDLSGGGVDINLADDTHTLAITNNGKTLTFNFVLTGNVAAGDNIAVGADWESQWDSSEVSAPGASDVTF